MISQIADGDAFQVASAYQSPKGSGGFDLREIWAAFYRSRYWIGGIFALAIIAAILFTLLATPYYSSSASLEIRQEAEKVLGTEADRESASSRLDTERFLQTQLDIIRSRSVATTVAENLGLFRGNAFLETMHAGEARASRILSAREAHREDVLKVLNDNISVGYTGDTRIAVLTFTSPDARLAARVANGFADAFIRNNLERRASSSTYALDFLKRQLAEAQGRLQESERAAVDYARRTRIVDASNAAGSSAQAQPQSLITAQLVQLNETFAAATSKRIEAQQKWLTTERLPLLSIPDVLSNQAIQQLIGQRAETEAKYKEQLANRQDSFPAVRELAAQVAETNRQITSLASSIRNSIRSNYTVAASHEREIAAKLDALKNGTLSEQNQTIQLSILRREADTNRQQYDALLRRYNALNAEAGVQTNNLTIVDRAEVAEKPSWPKLPISIGAALAVAILLSVAFVIGREQLLDVVRTPQDVTDRMHQTLLGAIPAADDPHQAVLDVKSPINEALSSMRASLALATPNGIPRSLMFTSTQAGEGKSNTCYGLARSLARLGKRVIVIDMDLRRPNAHRMFGVENKNGVTNVLTNQISLANAIRPTDLEGLWLLPAGDVPPNPSDLIDDPRALELIDTLSERYDIVLVDSAPVLGLADAILLASHVEAVAFIVEAGRNSIRGAQHAVARVTEAGGTVLGVVLTKFDPIKLGYGGHSDYGYNYGYEYSSRS